jgi:hypothetical protein
LISPDEITVMNRRHGEDPHRLSEDDSKRDATAFDPIADVWDGAREALAVIRERMRRGGPGWIAGGDQ